MPADGLFGHSGLCSGKRLLRDGGFVLVYRLIDVSADIVEVSRFLIVLIALVWA